VSDITTNPWILPEGISQEDVDFSDEATLLASLAEDGLPPWPVTPTAQAGIDAIADRWRALRK
jgi:hypothetical protein